MRVSCKGLFVVFMLVSVLGLAACKQEGPAEKAGKKIDQTTEQAGQKIEKTGVVMDDSAITAKIKSEIAIDPLLKAFQITVTTKNGVVKLSGVVDSQQSIDRALEITRNVKNVQSTENNLVVKRTN